MSVEVVLDSPLAQALNSSIQPKLVEVGWSTGGADDSALSEYIILMLVNGKTQEQIAAELSGDLLNLGDDDPGARDFSQWLFDQVDVLNRQLNGGGFQVQDSSNGVAQNEATNGQDAEMGDVSDAGDRNVYAISANLFKPDLRLPPKPPLTYYNSPTGPKSMRNGGGNSRPRDKRMLNQLVKTMDRSHDSILHRVRPQVGNERINTHVRGPPTGPRQATPGRGGLRPQQNGRAHGMMPGMPMQTGAGPNALLNMSPQQQIDLYAMLEQQSQMMAQMMNSGLSPIGGGFPNPGFPQRPPPGSSLFSRIQANPQRPQGNSFQKRPQNGSFGEHKHPRNDASDTSMDVDMSSQEKAETLSPEETTCKYNLACTNKDCKFAHQSPAAPPNTTIDVSDSCSFGAACKNRKCTGRHPSPAQKIAHQTELDCKFFPNCTNPRCPFRHPTMPLCRNGADCSTPECKFTHVQTKCKFNPCLNPICSFKHEEGQKRGKFGDKVWVAPDAAKENVSERKFVDGGGAEELIVPGSSSESPLSQNSTATAEIVTDHLIT